MTYRPNAEMTLDSLGTVALSDTTELAAVNPGATLGNATALALLGYLTGKSTNVANATVVSSLLSGDMVIGLRSGAAVLIPTSLLGAGGGTSPATAFKVQLSASTVVSGSPITVTVSPDGGLSWPSSTTVTPSVSGVSGAFSPTSAQPSGTSAASFQFTPSAAGTASINAAASGMTSDGAQTLTVTSSVSPATSYTISTASSGTAGTAQNVTVQSNGSLSSAVVVTLSDGASGTFGGTVTLASGNNTSGTTTYTPASAGTKSITGTNNGSLTNPSAVSVTVAAAGSNYPTLNVISGSPTYTTTGQKFGSAALVGPCVMGATINLPSPNFCVEMVFKSSTNTATTNVVSISDGTNTIGWGFNSDSRVAASKAAGDFAGSGNTLAFDGAYHYVAADRNTSDNNMSASQDGATYQSYYSSTFTGGSACTFRLNVPSGMTVDAIKVSNVSKYPCQTASPGYSAAPTRDSNTVVIWQLDGNGTGS